MAQRWIGCHAMKEYPNSFQAPRQPTKIIKIGNHGGSPPILGLKVATPELKERRFNRLHTPQTQYMLNTTIIHTIH